MPRNQINLMINYKVPIGRDSTKHENIEKEINAHLATARTHD